ncbi:hypothetical protein LTR53_007204 [Teratosphaeriaceae sp. CCFEE 6253]|nr:hypothetical protein LTR53_007204 [Teratosphaeriaceae sp. CCFEE 6253]
MVMLRMRSTLAPRPTWLRAGSTSLHALPPYQTHRHRQHKPSMADQEDTAPVALPRIAITFCTQCKWMLRAAYFAQELLSTFGTDIGEIALIPATGGIFTVHLTHKPVNAAETQQTLLWDRKTERGFPETKILKQLVRNHIQPEKKLGHSDTPSSKTKVEPVPSEGTVGAMPNGSGSDPLVAVATETATHAQTSMTVNNTTGQECEDCK